MKKYTPLLTMVLAPLFLVACGQKIPECGNEEVRKTVLKMLTKSILEQNQKNLIYANENFSLKEKFDTITMLSESNIGKQCQASIVYSFPEEYEEKYEANVLVNYQLSKNETSDGAFSILINQVNLTDAVKMQNSSGLLFDAYVKKSIGVNLSQDQLFAPITNGLIAKNYKEDQKDCKDRVDGLGRSRGSFCTYLFSDNKTIIEIVTSVNTGGVYRGNVAIPVGEIVESYKIKQK